MGQTSNYRGFSNSDVLELRRASTVLEGVREEFLRNL